MMKIATVCSGIGSPEQALKEIKVPHEITFACEIDKHARQTYLANFEPQMMLTDMTKEEWVGDEYYSDLFIGGIPCQAFSLAGKRMGELDPRGMLFFDFYRYVKNQKPKVFIIENVKGLLSDNNGVTFQNWCQLLGQSMNTHYNMFNHEDSLMYNLHFKVLNSKDFGVPQNRERVFLIGIRNDLPNTFRFPVGERLKIRLKDILEPIVDEKYYLSDKMINCLSTRPKLYDVFKPKDGGGLASTIKAGCHKTRADDNFIQEMFIVGGSQENQTPRIDGISPAVTSSTGNINIIGFINQDTQASQVYETNGVSPTVSAGTHGYALGYIEEPELKIVGNIEGKHEAQGRVYSENSLCPTIDTMMGGNRQPKIQVKEATMKGYAEASDGDSINLSNPNSETRRGRVGNQIANTLDTACNQAVVNKHRIRRLTPLECMRLQGYPDQYIKPCSDTQTYKQAGNSITVNVMKEIIKNLLPILCTTT